MIYWRTHPKLMSMAKFVRNKRVQVARQDQRDLSALACVGAAMRARGHLPEARLQAGAFQCDSLGASPVNQRDDIAPEVIWGRAC